MNIQFDLEHIMLDRRQSLRIDDGQGYQLHCRSGEVWLTQQGDGRDIILAQGQSFTLDRPGKAVGWRSRPPP